MRCLNGATSTPARRFAAASEPRGSARAKDDAAMASRRALIYVSGAAYRTATVNNVYASWTDLTGASGCTAPAAICARRATDVAAENAQLSDKVHGYNLYPVLRVGVSYQF